MPFYGQRFLGSRCYSRFRRNPRAGLAAIALWWEAWQQCPAASLPDDDFDLCGLAGFGEDLDAWRAAKETAMHGFVLCSDGRFYHKFLAQEAVKAFDLRLKADKRRLADRERLREWRETQKKQSTVALVDRCDTADETRFETSNETPVETPNETRFVAADKTRKDSTVLKKDISAANDAAKEKGSPGRVIPGWREDVDFVAFYDAYPRKLAPKEAHKAWIAAKKAGANTLEIMAGLGSYPFATDHKFMPYPATWLRGESWFVEHSRPAGGERPSPNATRTMQTATGRILTAEELFQVST